MLLFTDSLFQEHDTGSHPENSGRLQAIDRKLAGTDLLKLSRLGTVVPASLEAIQAVHSEEMINKTRTLAESGGGQLDPDTRVSPRSYDVALQAAGTACSAVEQVLTGHESHAACLFRPPGHHALPHRAMGFCLFNNIAIAARHAQKRCELGKILIVDWDVHHGNGTQDIFYEDESVGFLSIHRFPFYPGTGAREETGSGAGLGTTWNIPVSMGTPFKEYFDQFQKTLDAATKRMKPELILLSAGFDAHRLDPIGSLGLETEHFGLLTESVIAAADAECGGRIVSLLEGGYHPEALADSVFLHLTKLAESM